MKKLSLTLILILILMLIPSCSFPLKTKEYKEQQFLMDTVMNITVYGTDDKTLKSAVVSAYAEFKRLALLTDRFPAPNTEAFKQSDICKVNASAGISEVKVDSDVFNMIEQSIKYNALSNGAFDITVGPLIDAFGFATNHPKVPTDTQLKEAIAKTGDSNIILDKNNSTVFLKKSGMILDLGGVSKGYAAQKAADKLRSLNIKSAIIDAGGNIVTIGLKNGKTNFNVGVEDPRDVSSIIAVVPSSDTAIVTSGDYQRNFTENGVLYHHILSTKDGKPTRGIMSATVITKDSGLADILSTTLFILGYKDGLKFASSIGGVEVIYVTSDNKIYMSDSLKGKVQIKENGKYTYEQS